MSLVIICTLSLSPLIARYGGVRKKKNPRHSLSCLKHNPVEEESSTPFVKWSAKLERSIGYLDGKHSFLLRLHCTRNRLGNGDVCHVFIYTKVNTNGENAV
ncbi:hypothetical protein AVEN_86373-1 [Araneus ventricosus]|uniref:Secreted protein n=1 Tax=Araneus ventricosus TaxID=182803 RepID=A0A4Y2SKX2_ARAVE|nr:hypothetical protein AVEN_86373-1 [Araneus ventricosus]